MYNQLFLVIGGALSRDKPGDSTTTLRGSSPFVKYTSEPCDFICCLWSIPSKLGVQRAPSPQSTARGENRCVDLSGLSPYAKKRWLLSYCSSCQLAGHQDRARARRAKNQGCQNGRLSGVEHFTFYLPSPSSEVKYFFMVLPPKSR